MEFIAPFAKVFEWGDAASSAMAVILGIGFGFALERGGLGNPRILAGQWFGYNFAVLRVIEGVGVDDRAARRVDQNGGRLHQSELRRTDHPGGFLRQVAVQRNHIRLHQQGFEIHRAHIVPDENRVLRVRIASTDPRAPGR